MNARALVLLLSVLLFDSVCFASIPTDFFLLDCSQGYFRVAGGKLKIGARSGLENLKAPEHWYVLGTQIKSSMSGAYLAYDPSGKDRQVVLATKTGENTEWVITRKSEGEKEYAIVKAAKGPFKGWSLDVEGGHLILREKPSNPVKVARIYRSL